MSDQIMPNNILRDFMRCASLIAVLMAGSCAAPTNDASARSEDGTFNHPITVEPSYRSLDVYFSPADAGLMPQDSARFESFIADYRAHGNGSIAISAPSGPGARAAIDYFAGRIAAMGVPRNSILVATHDASADDQRVDINYVSYEAHTDKCGDWDENLANTEDNSTAKNFGCAVQQNIAAQVADPRDLIQPREMSEADAARRATVLSNYEQGKITSSDKRKGDLSNEQSGTSSDINK